MPQSLFGRVARPAFTFTAGLLAASALTANVAAAPATVSSTLTRTASCAGLDFNPRDAQAATGYGSSLTLRTAGDSGGYFLCDPGLPNKATVTKVRFTVRDLSATNRVTGCSLVRSHLVASSASASDTLASVPFTSGTPGTVRLSTSTISNGLIDNTRYGYWLQCTLTGDEVGIYGADVTYRISSTDG